MLLSKQCMHVVQKSNITGRFIIRNSILLPYVPILFGDATL